VTEAPILGLSYVYIGLSYVYIGRRKPAALALHESCGYEIIKNHGRFRDLSNLAATLETCDRALRPPEARDEVRVGEACR
jgi:hypothetical protein